MSNRKYEHRWAVILAGGDGTRLKPLTRALTGDDRPKQFCPIISNRTLLDHTQRRVALLLNPSADFSSPYTRSQGFYQQQLKDWLLELQPDKLSVLRLRNVGWTDLGEPRRVAATFELR